MSTQDSQDKKKKRRWDIPGSGANASEASNTNQPSPNAPPAGSGSMNAAQLAAAKLQQILAQKGIVTSVTGAASAEFEINDYPSEIRYLITRGATHDQIRKETGASVLSRGSYRQPGDNLTDRPLHLLITGESEAVVNKGKEKIKEIIATASSSFIAKVYIGLENSRPEFGLIPRLLGKQGTFVKYINTETAAKIQLHGRGSGYLEANTKVESPDALHFVITAPTQIALDRAKSMAQDLIVHVQRDYKTFYSSQPSFSPPVTYAHLPPMPYPPPPPGTGVMIPPPSSLYSSVPPPMYMAPAAVPATDHTPLYPDMKRAAKSEEKHEPATKEELGVGPPRPTAADMEQARSRLVELPDHAYESHSASEDDERSRSDAELMPPPPRITPGTVSPAKRKRRNSLTHPTDDKYPASKKHKTSAKDESSESGFKLVNYDENEADDDKFTAPRTKTPFWAAPPPGKPIFAVLGGEEPDEDEEGSVLSSNGKDYDRLHNEVLKGLGIK